MAGNDTQGLRYGTIETPSKYYLKWKEDVPNTFSSELDFHLSRICNKQRFLQIIHDFIVFDAGVKKTCRHNQFLALKPPGVMSRNGKAVLFGIPKAPVKV